MIEFKFIKKFLSIILPSIIILAITFLSRADKNILLGLFLLFPITFIIQGLIYSDFKKDLIIGFILSSMAFIIPVNIWYNIGDCIKPLVIYNILGVVSYFLKKKIISIKK